MMRLEENGDCIRNTKPFLKKSILAIPFLFLGMRLSIKEFYSSDRLIKAQHIFHQLHFKFTSRRAILIHYIQDSASSVNPPT